MTSWAADVALTPPSATILVVDDSPVNLQVLVRTLHGTGHRILAARTAARALDIARRAQPDLVLLDVMMPEHGRLRGVPRHQGATRRRAGHRRDLPVGARRRVRQGVGPGARRRGLHHQADSGRGSAGPRRDPPAAAASRARAATEPRPARTRARERRADAAADPAAAAARASAVQFAAQLPDEPPRRRRLLRRAAARRAIASASWWPTSRATARRRPSSWR